MNSLSETNFPLVSIVAINFNNSNYVIETLESIDAQTYSNTELIVVDDCSTDDSIQKIENWLLNYKKPYQFICSPRNEGVCATCNKGYKAAKGKYISSIATDDVMLPEKIAKQAYFFELLADDVGMIYGDAYLIDDNSNKLAGTFIKKFRDFDNPPSGNIFKALIEGNYIPAMATMVRASILPIVGYFDENLLYEDFDMWLRISKVYQVIFQNEITVKYRIRKNSLTTKKHTKEWLMSTLEIYTKHQENELVKKQITNTILSLYLNDYPYRELYNKYNPVPIGYGLTYNCMKVNVPAFVTRFLIRTLDKFRGNIVETI